MQVKADNERVLMSETLRGQLLDLGVEPEAPVDPAQGVITVIADKRVGGMTTAMVGVLRGIMLGNEPEIEFRCDLNDALDVLEADQLSFGGFELHHGERIVHVKGPFVVKAARLDEVELTNPLCTLGLHLVRPAR